MAEARTGAAASLDGVRVHYTGRPPLGPLDLTLAPGEIVAMVGASGAGKSTVLRLLAGLEPPSAGTVHLTEGRTGFVFQHHDLVGRASTLTNVVHGALGRVPWWRAFAHGVAPAALRAEAMACLSRVGLPHVATQRADRLSGGQSQRVAIARALMQQPELLLADEPAASLDPAAGEEVMGVFRALARAEGMTVVFTSHHVSHALGYADRVVGLRAGRVELDAPTASIDAGTVHALYS